MSDLIRRQAAIEAISSMFAPTPTQHDMVEDCLEIIDNLPSADRPKGKWYHGEAYPHHLYCSVCYRTALPNDEYVERWNLHMNFCPHCGADMKGGEA